MPPGVGIVDVKFPAKGAELMGTGTRILLDPMTKEVIGKMPVLDEYGQPKLDRGKPMYEINDHWFVLNAKFVWKECATIARASYGCDAAASASRC